MLFGADGSVPPGWGISQGNLPALSAGTIKFSLTRSLSIACHQERKRRCHDLSHFRSPC